MDSNQVATTEIAVYIENQIEAHQNQLNALYAIIRDTLPNATEKITWGMPTFWEGKNLVHFAANKNHIGLYPGGEATAFFKERLEGYKTSKGSIHFSYDQPLDRKLIQDIVIWVAAGPHE